ncbi:hypothetical protein TNCV_4592681 [Trichonephila clavipes]|nr:hypothetical protein TNCV_4592681 [Trichonephila clavipes]
MSKSKEFSEFDGGSIVGCHLYGISIHEIADILKKPKSTEFQSSSGIRVSSRTVCREFKNLGFHGQAAAHKPKSLHRMRSIYCNGVELTVIELWTCRKLFFGVMNLALQAGCRMDASGFGECPANVSLVTALYRLLSWVVEA